MKMKKMIFRAVMQRNSGDGYTLIVTFDRVEAIKAVEADRNHLTNSELRVAKHWIEGWEIPVEDGVTAEEAFRYCEQNLYIMCNPAFYEVRGIPMTPYDYSDFRFEAMKHRNDYMADVTARNLADWLNRYGSRSDWNGESWDIDDGYRLVPIYEETEPDEFEIIRWEIH